VPLREEASRLRPVLITNNGNAVLSDFGLSTIGSHATEFSIAPPSTTAIAPGETNLVSNPLYSEKGHPATNPLFDDSARLAFYRDNGLFLARDVHAMHVDTPLLERIPRHQSIPPHHRRPEEQNATPQQLPNVPHECPPTSINGQGKLEFLFSDPDDAALFRLESR
jgi:hypothetical protein